MPDITPDEVHDGNTKPIPVQEPTPTAATVPLVAPDADVPSAQAGEPGSSTQRAAWLPWLLVGVLAVALIALAIFLMPYLSRLGPAVTPSPSPTTSVSPTEPAENPNGGGSNSGPRQGGGGSGSTSDPTREPTAEPTAPEPTPTPTP